ncbi:uncharacterized protein TRIADDRAFT_25047, partial [Trichoplax adhaerens]
FSTAKYNLITFFPKFLFEQFSRYANLFFLFITLIQQIPGVSPTGKWSTAGPLILVLSISAIKELIEDYARHKADREVNHSKILVARGEKFVLDEWRNIVTGDIVKVTNCQLFPSDLILLSSSEPQGMCYIQTANLDGETNLKIRQALPETASKNSIHDLQDLQGYVECEGPNNRLYRFVGNLSIQGQEPVPIGANQILLRGAQLRNTQWVYGLVIYTGHESKLMQNTTMAPIKRSNVEHVTNDQIIFLFFLLIGLSLLSAIVYEGYRLKPAKFGMAFLTFVILYNNLIPISLIVTLEIVRFVQGLLIGWDLDMYYEQTDTPAKARTSNLNEELGQVKYVFSDKTGTLTRNVMEFRRCSIAGKVYGIEGHGFDDTNLLKDLSEPAGIAPIIREMLTMMAICHTVIPDYQNEDKSIVTYQAASPDEDAIVCAARNIGFTFTARTPNTVTIRVLGKEEIYEVLSVLEFNSTRKRMSVIVRCPDGKIKLYCKGADSVIYARLHAGGSPFADQTSDQLREFAVDGLRTLCFGMRELTESQFSEWNEMFKQASTAMEDRDSKIDEAAELIEKELYLIGASAIEDKLQEYVPETIAALAKAGINLWVLTGDKQETAINIGYSCRLLNDDMAILIVNDSTLAGVRTTLYNHVQAFGDNLRKDNNTALVIDGHALQFALEKELKDIFLDIALSCKSIICCRVSPLQKSLVVQLVRNEVKAITLAIGDGANDVGMIQTAHIGIGISGQEGMQAVCAADYSIARFHFLRKLLFVHGNWSYNRICKCILYCFYKNYTLYLIEFWFATVNGFSGQTLFNQWTISVYNIIFTSLPPIAIGIFDQTLSPKSLLQYPKLYKETQKNDTYNTKVFWLWTLNAVFHTLVIFWLIILAFTHEIPFINGKVVGEWFVGNVIYTAVVVTVNLKIALLTDYWNWVTHLVIWGSIISWFLFLFMFCNLWPAVDIGSNMAGLELIMFKCPSFWFTVIIVAVITLFRDCVWAIIQRTFFKTLTQEVQELEQRQVSNNG